MLPGIDAIDPPAVILSDVLGPRLRDQAVARPPRISPAMESAAEPLLNFLIEAPAQAENL